MNIYNFSEIISSTVDKLVIAFGEDPFGNFWCFDYSDHDEQPSVVFWNHELAQTVSDYNFDFVSNSFSEFLNKIQEPHDE